MFKLVAKLLAVIAIIVGVAYWHRTELSLRWARHVFPTGWAPPQGWPASDDGHHVTTLGKGFQVGDLLLGDGTRIPYWFLSHHQSGDLGGTLFELPEGRTKFVEGYFCCSVDLSAEETATRATFDATLERIDGLSP